jgi:ADP-dependent NAD(P)H-hydrate dehydratase
MAKFLKMGRDEVEKDALGSARAAAHRLEAVVAMKGASTHVVSPQGEALLNDHDSIDWPHPVREIRSPVS